MVLYARSMAFVFELNYKQTKSKDTITLVLIPKVSIYTGVPLTNHS